MRNREIKVYSGIGIFYGSLSYGLYNAWYKNYPSGKFHFFNDNNEWLQMDKVGHAFSCYSEGVSGINLMDYVGLSKKKSMWIGGMIGLGMQSIVEIMDGYSTKWGFSWGDMGANVVGTSLAISQRYFAFGYGGYGMITGDPNDDNKFESHGILYDYSSIERYRIFYFAPDISLQKIPYIKKHRTLFIIARFLAPLKVPLPAMQYDKKKGLSFRAYYF